MDPSLARHLMEPGTQSSDITLTDRNNQENQILPQGFIDGFNPLCPDCKTCFLTCLFPCIILGAWKVIEPSEVAVLTSWGKYVGTIGPGNYCINPCCLDSTIINTKLLSTALGDIRATDKDGSPIVVSGVVKWRVVSAERAVLEVTDYSVLVTRLCTGALKMGLSHFPFESRTEPSIRTHPEQVTDLITKIANQNLAMAGVRVESVSITDMSYAPEIAAQMLVRQQAGAVMKARRILVNGAVTIAEAAMSQLLARGVPLPPDEAGRTVSNLLTVLCADTEIHPVIELE